MYTEKREVLTKEKCKQKLLPSRTWMILAGAVSVFGAALSIGIAIAVLGYFRSYFGGRPAEDIDGLDAIWGGMILLCFAVLIGAAIYLVYYFIVHGILANRKLQNGHFLIVEDELIRFSEEMHYRSRGENRGGVDLDYFAHFAKTGKYQCAENFQMRHSVGDLFYVVVLDGEYIEPYAVYSKQTHVCYEVDDLYE